MPLPLLTERLILRPMAPTDAEALHRVWGDPEAMRHISVGPSRDLEHTRQRLAGQLAAQAERGYSLYAVVDRAAGEVIGDCGLLTMEDSRVQLGYRLAPEVWGRGLATEAARAVLAHARDELGIREVYGLALPENAASRRVLEKVGMRYVGVESHHGDENAVYVLSLGRDDGPAARSR